MTKFSIITPSYTQSLYIAETIKSVLSQKGDFTIEYFVIDGGSTDGSVEIIEHYANLVKSGNWFVQCNGISMKWVSQKDNGQSDAINHGMRDASGDIISYINSDDLYIPGAFAHVADGFIEHPDADFVYGDGNVIDAEGKLNWEWLSRPYHHKLMKSYHFLWNDFTNYILQQATFWRKQVIEQIGYFDESFHYALDVEYWIRAGGAGLKLQHIPYKLGEFRMIPGTKSLSSHTAFWGDYLEIFRRYRGSHRMTAFFTYYYYNLAKQCHYKIDQMPLRDSKVFKRWERLPSKEKQQIEKQADQGLAISCLLLANDLLHRQPDRAAIVLEKGILEKPYLRLHLFSLCFYLRRVLGPGLSSKLDILGERLVRKYKWVRYSKRYHQKVERAND